MLFQYVLVTVMSIFSSLVFYLVWFRPKVLQKWIIENYTRANADFLGMRKLTVYMIRIGLWIWIARAVSLFFIIDAISGGPVEIQAHMKFPTPAGV